MARRRMISSKITDTDSFAAMSLRAKFLYYELLLKADDDGFLASPIRIIKMAGCKKSDLDELVKNGYIIEFTTGVIVIRDWKIHNNIRKDMYEETIYQNEFSMLQIYKNRYYLKTECNVTEDVTEGVTENVTEDVTEDVTQDRLGKGSIEKDSIDNALCPEPVQPPQDPSGILLSLVDKTEYNVPLSKIEKWKTAYPAVDIVQELHKMAVWLDSNPQRKKTRRGIDRFINSWLSREQDKGRVYNSSDRQQSEPISYDLPPEYQEMYDKYLSKEPPGPDDPFQ